MDTRIEDDMIEVAADGNYLMLCRGRETLFLDGACTGKVALADIASFAADGQAVVVHLRSGETRTQPFPSAPPEAVDAVTRNLNTSAEAWR